MKKSFFNRAATKFFAASTAAALALGFTLTGCSSASDSKPKIRIGIKYDQPGLGYQDGQDYTGFDVDVARYIAGKLGYSEDQIEFVESPSANRENMLSNGQVDMILATYSISDSRKKSVDFAGPYYVAGQDLLVRADETSITGPDSLKEPMLGDRLNQRQKDSGYLRQKREPGEAE